MPNAGVEGHHPAAQLGQVPVVIVATETLWNYRAGVQGKSRSRAEQDVGSRLPPTMGSTDSVVGGLE